MHAILADAAASVPGGDLTITGAVVGVFVLLGWLVRSIWAQLVATTAKGFEAVAVARDATNAMVLFREAAANSDSRMASVEASVNHLAGSVDSLGRWDQAREEAVRADERRKVVAEWQAPRSQG